MNACQPTLIRRLLKKERLVAPVHGILGPIGAPFLPVFAVFLRHVHGSKKMNYTDVLPSSLFLLTDLPSIANFLRILGRGVYK